MSPEIEGEAKVALKHGQATTKVSSVRDSSSRKDREILTLWAELIERQQLLL